jgi:hypothetical protein
MIVMAALEQEYTQPTSILEVVAGVTFLAIIYSLVTGGGVAGTITALGNLYAAAITAARGGGG